MEQQSQPQNLMSGSHQAPVNPASLPPEYWDLYANPDPSHHHSHPPPQQSPQPSQQLQSPRQQQTPLGIGWDHPVLHQQHPQPSHRDHAHGIYPPSTSQMWQQNQLHHQPIVPSTPQNLGIPAQYRQVPQYAQGQVTFDSRPVPPTDNSHYQSFSFSPNFYTPQHVSIPEAFPQSHPSHPAQQQRQQQPQAAAYPSLHQNSDPQFTLPTTFTDEHSSSINFPNEFGQPPSSIAEHTINPQFLGPPQSGSQNSSLHNQFIYVNPAGDPKMFNFYPDDLQMQSVLGQPVVNNSVVPGQIPKAANVPFNGQNIITPGVLAKSSQIRAKQPGAKKASQTKKASAKATGKKADGKASASSSESDTSDDSDLEIQEPEEPSPIPPVRPTEPEAAARYDVLRAVWFPRNRRPNVDKVKTALVAFKDVVKTVRDTWKENAQALKAAENKGETSETAELRKRVTLQRRLMDVVVSATLENGHPMIVEKLGEHPMALAAMYSFLLDRHQASDIDGTLTVNILKLLARFITMDEDVLQKTNVAKLLPRFVKKGGQVVKDLSQSILDNAAASTKRKQENGKPASKEGSPSKNSVSDATAVDGARKDATGVKRPRDGEINGQPATKRVVVMSNVKSVSKPTSSSASVPAKRAQEVGPDGKPTATAATLSSRPKANIVAPKPTSLFGSLLSASKKPGTSNAERAAAAAAAAAAKASNSTEKKDSQPAPSRPAFSFGDLMADLDKQKDTSPLEASESKTPETEEERKKRLRKEARRKLRVTWKPDESLTEVRFFTHDPDEELGPGDPSRQVGDIKGEGSVLRLHRDLDELEEDEEGGMREEQLFEYFVPAEIDKDNISPEDRSRSYIKRGGTQKPTSAEAKAQEHREATTLMVFYTSPADVPPSPKEPPPADASETAPEVLSFGELPDHVKARQERYHAAIKPQQTPQSQPSTQNNQLVTDLLKIIQNAGPQQQSTPTPPPAQPAQAPLSDLERTISMFRQQQPPQPPQTPLFPIPQIAPVSQPSQQQGFDYQKLLAVFNAQQQMQQQQQPQQAVIPPNLAAIISQFSNQNQQAGANLPQTSNYHEDPERKRMREYGGYDGNSDERFKRNRLNAPNKKHPKAGLVPCRYWREGKCLKGEDCTFRHDPL